MNSSYILILLLFANKLSKYGPTVITYMDVLIIKLTIKFVNKK